jgi:uncharacterized coiled-coil protein SlyX
MLGQLAEGDRCRRFHRELGQLVRDQEDVARRTTEVARRTLAQELRDLSAQDTTDLNAVAGRQFELARLFDRILQEMDRAGGELRETDPPTAETVADALDAARRSAIGGQMRAAGAEIERNQMGRAVADQKQVGRRLQEVLDILANRRRQTAKSGPSAAGESQANAPPKSTSSGSPKAGATSAAAPSPGSAGVGKASKPNIQQTRAAMSRLWGELPARARQQMLQSPVEQFPPKYELLIEEYFRRLSEEKEKR